MGTLSMDEKASSTGFPAGSQPSWRVGGAGNERGVSVVPAKETAAGAGPVCINGAFPVHEKFAAILDIQCMVTREGEVEAACAEVFEPFILMPGKFHVGKRTTAGPVAIPAPAVIVYRMVQKHAVLLRLRAAE